MDVAREPSLKNAVSCSAGHGYTRPTNPHIDRFYNYVHHSASVYASIDQNHSLLSRKLRIFQSLRWSSCGVICSGFVFPSFPSALAWLSSPISSISSRSLEISVAVFPGALDSIFFSVATITEFPCSFFLRPAAKTLWFRSVRED